MGRNKNRYKAAYTADVMAPPESVQTPWLTQSKPPGFAQSADLILVLHPDSNFLKAEIPCHVAFLAAHSPVLCDMLTSSDCKATVSAEGETRRVPLPDASLDQATNFLNFVYSQADFKPSVNAAISMLGLLHRFECTAALQKMDTYLASNAGALMPPTWVSAASTCTAPIRRCSEEDRAYTHSLCWDPWSGHACTQAGKCACVCKHKFREGDLSKKCSCPG